MLQLTLPDLMAAQSSGNDWTRSASVRASRAHVLEQSHRSCA
jgi:hypothetical protein